MSKPAADHPWRRAAREAMLLRQERDRMTAGEATGNDGATARPMASGECRTLDAGGRQRRRFPRLDELDNDPTAHGSGDES